MNDKELAQRLEKLERDNRRLKRVTVGAVALAAALGAIYAVACSSSGVMPGAERVTAHAFDVVDGAGKVRVKIAMECHPRTVCQPSIKMFDQDGNEVTTIGAGTVGVSGGEETATLQGGHLQFSVSDKGSKPRVTAELGSGTGGGGLMSLVGNDGGYVRVNANSPSVEIKDAQGYMMDLGAVDLTTVVSGQTSQTTADSIVMFANDKEHHMIWRAP
ncbi:MAG TPA: hypothetical protein VNM47_15790 [Terriglobia bacterium]|nr:hypothetical protein [Terriglobia bacterium]